jgi:glycine cleavage system H protein
VIIPNDFKYTASHEWAKIESDGVITVGITDFAQDNLGDIVFVELPKLGRVVHKGEACCVVESVKAASDVYAPVSGEIIAANQDLPGAWQRINQAPYGTWLFRIRPNKMAELASLLEPSAYTAALQPRQ